jgi:hypothetical protein
MGMEKHFPGLVGSGPYKPLCTCGWIGEASGTSAEAWGDAGSHVAGLPAAKPKPLLRPDEGQRLLLLRERVRSPSPQLPSWGDVDFLLQLFDRARAIPTEGES